MATHLVSRWIPEVHWGLVTILDCYVFSFQLMQPVSHVFLRSGWGNAHYSWSKCTLQGECEREKRECVWKGKDDASQPFHVGTNKQQKKGTQWEINMHPGVSSCSCPNIITLTVRHGDRGKPSVSPAPPLTSPAAQETYFYLSFEFVSFVRSVEGSLGVFISSKEKRHTFSPLFVFHRTAPLATANSCFLLRNKQRFIPYNVSCYKTAEPSEDAASPSSAEVWIGLQRGDWIVQQGLCLQTFKAFGKWIYVLFHSILSYFRW